VVKESGGSAVVRYDDKIDKLVVSKANGGGMLPDDLYLKFDGGKPDPGQSSSKAPG
jgi:hypothetical protein